MSDIDLLFELYYDKLNFLLILYNFFVRAIDLRG